MTTSIIKNKLHHFIENADLKELKKVYSFLEDELEQSLDSIWENNDFVKELERRSDEIKSGKVKGISWERIKRKTELPK